MKHLKLFSLVTASALFFSSCQKQDLTSLSSAASETANSPFGTSKNSKGQSEVATDWMNTYRRAVQAEGKNPAQASRIYAYASMSLYEAVVPGMNNYNSLEGQVAGYDNAPSLRNMGQVDFSICANEALYQTAVNIFGSLKPANKAMFDSIHSEWDGDAGIKQNVISNSTNFGRAVASAVLARAGKDNFAETRLLSYVVPSTSVDPSFWSPTGPVTSPLEPYWGSLKPFAMQTGAACTIKSAISFSTATGSEFYSQALEVANVTSSLTKEEKDIALWWNDNAGATPTPPGHWVGIAAQIAKEKNLDLGRTAEMFAALNMTMADAFISCWNEKYRMNLLRPVSYIRAYIPGKTTWSSLIGTPPFPEYPSGHSVASGAAAEILTKLFGNVAFTDASNTFQGLSARSYSSFREAAGEAAISRLYGGIHYREAIENGLLQGKEVSAVMMKAISFRK